MLHDLWFNFTHNLFKPLLLFFYLGFLVPILRVPLEFPKVLYQSLTIYLLVAIGWHGGEELASLSAGSFYQALGFMLIGFATNFVIGILAYAILRRLTRLRRIDAATVAGYYGSDSAGTFVTCVGVLSTIGIVYAAYMPVMLAVMEIPGCLVALYLVSRLRQNGMDRRGNMADEPGYNPQLPSLHDLDAEADHADDPSPNYSTAANGAPYGAGGGAAVATAVAPRLTTANQPQLAPVLVQAKPASVLNWKILHEVFLNPGLFLLFGGILIGFLSRLQGRKVVESYDSLFVALFQAVLCLFLLEMGMTACKRLRDLRNAGWRFITFGLVAPNVFASLGMFVAHGYSYALGTPLDLGTYVVFAVLCGAASYIAVPAVQRMAIPEASPTLPLAASLGLTFSYNVTIGIPIYIEIAKAITRTFPVT